MNVLLSIYWVPFAAGWMFANGILHDIFVLIRHKDGYNRDLLRLLMDGHLLILSGTILFVCYLLMRAGNSYGAIISIIIAVSMLIYCAMIFPFLKSFVTTAISLMLILVSVKFLLSIPGN